MSDDTLYVTRPFLPPLDELVPLLAEIWGRRILTNHGPVHQRFEQALSDYLGVPHVSLVANGTLALDAAIEAAALSGEVVTTPYSFVATTHAIRRAGLEPVFVDVRPSDLNLDAELVEAAITERTSAIVAVHCYGNPCDTARLRQIADRHGLKLIYDAAHAFGVSQAGRPLVAEGDFSTISFHATKAFNTFEGGAVVSASSECKADIDHIRNFGIADELNIPAVGGNAKMSEFNAAVGILQLGYFEEVRLARRKVDSRYRDHLSTVSGIRPIGIPDGVDANHSYFPILVGEEFGLSRDDLYDRLKANGIHARRYFYPLLSTLPSYRDAPSASSGNLPVATQAANQILCLPIYHDLSAKDQDRVIAAIRG